MKTGLKVIDAMTKKPIFVSTGQTAKECSALMQEHHVGSIMVMDNGSLVGLITEQDLVYKIIAANLNPSTACKDIMSKELITISPKEDIYDAIIKMRDANVRRLPVVDGEELVGILTQKDILKIQPAMFDLIVDKIELKEEASKPINKVGDKEGLCELCGNYANYLFDNDGSLVCSECKD